MPDEHPRDEFSPVEYIYVQIADRIADDITNWAEGRRLPSEAELAEQYGVARMTIRRAKELLEKRGLIRILHGRGTFVVKPRD